MAEMKEFNTEFIKRTIEILNNCSDKTEYDTTLLINCLLGLLVHPIEDYKDEKISNINQYKTNCVNKLRELSSKSIKTDPNNKDDQSIFRNIRNSVAHLNVELGSYKGTIESITFSNRIGGKKGKVTLEFTLSVKNLKEFALYVGNEYLKMNKNQ